MHTECTQTYRLGLPAVERNHFELRHRIDQCDKIIARMVANIAIETPGTLSLGDNVPQADVAFQQRAKPIGIVHIDYVLPNHIADQQPESILLVCVVLVVRERYFARQATENQHARVEVNDRREATFHHHDSPLRS
ncbi:hypothetical protein Y048_4535 [Burkholderia pseudomallei MSHR456]|nr:hypothetical protein Y048_4535 [Burkholderia pseudomallei MSHR456]